MHVKLRWICEWKRRHTHGLSLSAEWACGLKRKCDKSQVNKKYLWSNGQGKWEEDTRLFCTIFFWPFYLICIHRELCRVKQSFLSRGDKLRGGGDERNDNDERRNTSFKLKCSLRTHTNSGKKCLMDSMAHVEYWWQIRLIYGWDEREKKGIYKNLTQKKNISSGNFCLTDQQRIFYCHVNQLWPLTCIASSFCEKEPRITTSTDGHI